MKKIFKIIGKVFLAILFILGMTIIAAFYDDYFDSKVDRVMTAVHVHSAGITIPTNVGYSVSTFNTEFTATPNEFRDYFEKVLVNDTINQIMITGQRLDSDTRKMKWAVVFNNYRPMQ